MGENPYRSPEAEEDATPAYSRTAVSGTVLLLIVGSFFAVNVMIQRVPNVSSLIWFAALAAFIISQLRADRRAVS